MDSSSATPRTLDELRKDSTNPRVITPNAAKGLGKSLHDFGDLSGIVWNKQTGELVAGHQRIDQLKKLGAVLEGEWITVPSTNERFRIRVVDWSKRRQHAANVIANNPEIAGEFTVDVKDYLAEAKAELGDEDYEALMLDQIEMMKAYDEQQTQEDEVPEPPKTAVSQIGDVWTLGSHKLACCDARQKKMVAELVGDAKGFLMATDPPYGVDFAGAKYNPRAKDWKGIENDELHGDGLRGFIRDALAVWLPHLEKTAAVYVWTAAMEEGAAAAAVRDCGLHVQSQIIWKKNALVLGQADYQWQHENCWYAFRKGEKHRWFGARDKTTVWEVSKVANSDYVHPMQKPLELYAIPMRHHTKTGEVCLDPFAGSGSCLIAAEQLGRRCYCAEIAPEYCDVIVERYENLTGDKATRTARQVG